MDKVLRTVPTARQGLVITAENDENHLLGRPNGYTSKVQFTDTRIKPIPDVEGLPPITPGVTEGGAVEVYPDEDGATARRDYIQGVSKAGGLSAGYTYLSGPVVLRVSEKLTPKQAAEYQRALR